MLQALTDILKQTDIFLPSGDELTLLVEAATEEAAIQELLALGIKEIVVKKGSQGCEYYGATHDDADRDDGARDDASRSEASRDDTARSDAIRRLSMPALKVKELDPTGAGDCFAATYVTCRHQNMPVEQSLRYACASGARAVMSKGPMEGTAGFADLDTLLAHQNVSGEAGQA